MNKQKTVTLNTEQRLYVIPEGKGYSCLGFDVCEQRTKALAAELRKQGIPALSKAPDKGTLAAYAHYAALVEIARQENERSGWRSASELTPELIGLEGCRVEVTHCWPESGEVERARFWVGKSCGWIPCHLEIKRRDSMGGSAVCFGDIQRVRVIQKGGR